ncbi:hypothetical protein JIG36_47115 [Actinoplanes sp. LDG1-06]|uniref:SMODS and SLOG-associating 2TM effector domain-containing protein n=1 Tax=Paractinoplanes ovalisporus TaxID=2810368 RepID=A0ABS2ATB6_9ACTN|nr:hypothetical protein [Actinoplanes ovalisporus]MBM2623097.1 hypothetical protein [Actinoplanes ovalisporus]
MTAMQPRAALDDPPARVLLIRRQAAAKATHSSAMVADLWQFYEEHATQARQHESLRATVTGTLAAIAGAITALAGVGGLSVADVPAGAAVVIISGLGVVLSLKHFERNRFHVQVMKQVQREIERVRDSINASPRPLSELWNAAKRTHREDFAIKVWKKKDDPSGSVWIDTRLYILWAGLPLGIAVVGVLVIVLGFIGIPAPK